jgi:hypothetical protein
MVRSRIALNTFFTLSALIWASIGTANAQQVFGSIFGTVTDPTGGAVANAKITVTDTNKGTSSVVMTDASGNYTKGQLIPDPYKVTIEAPGFQKAVSNEIDVRVDEASRFDASMKIGDVSTSVEVTAAAPLLQAGSADVAQTFTAKQLGDLPEIGRNAQSLELLDPGTARVGWQHASDENPQGSVQMVVNGQLFDSMGYELDGTTNQDPILGIIVINPTFDSLAEIKQANQNFDAEFEYVGGGIASYSTKSGSNNLHGDAFEYLQINTPGFTTFAANPFNGGLPSPLYRQNQFGGSIGGPVVKNKLFFFGDAQLNREAQGGSVVTSVPTALNRTGNFSDWLAYNSEYQIYNPNSGNTATGVGRSPYAGNIIPPSQLSPQAVALLNYWPLPNITPQYGPTQPFYNNYATNGDLTITDNQWNTREDYYINEKNTLFGRFSYFSATQNAPGAFGLEAGGPSFGTYAGAAQSQDQSIAIGETFTASPTLVNEFRFGYERYHVFDVPNGYGTTPATAAGIPGLNYNTTYASALPAFYVTSPHDQYELGYALGVNSCNCPLTQTESQYQFVDNLTKIVGNNTFKFGTDLRYAQNLRVPSDNHRAGELTFASTETGDVPTAGGNPTQGIGLATFLLGDVSSFGRYVSSSTDAQEQQPRFFFYGQDEWHPTPKWTLSLGVRYELVLPEAVNAAGNGATLDLQNGLMYVFGYGSAVSSHGIQNPNWHDFAPRIGLVYQLNKSTVIRAGYGWSYDLGVFGSNFGHNVTQNPPVLTYQDLQPTANFAGVFNLAQGPAGYTGGGVTGPNGLPTPPTISAQGTFPLPEGVNPKFRPAQVTLPQVYTYNLSLQHQFTNKIAATVAYVGNSERHNFLGTGQSINPNEAIFVPGQSNTNLDRPYYSIFGWTNDLSYYCDCSNAQYNSLQATLKINAWDGWTVQGSYTFQKQYGPGYDPYNNGPNYYFNYDRPAGYGNSNYLPDNQIIIAQNYDIPVGRDRKYFKNMNKAEDALLGGWTVSGITTFYSGFPFSPTFGLSYTGQPNTGPNNRPDMGTGAVYAGAQQNRNQWFNGCPIVAGAPNCTTGPYVYAPANTFGNYPINTLYGPIFIQQDMSLMKTFRLTEKIGFTLRADSSNVFNHTNLGLPNTNVDETTAGQITSLAAGSANFMRRLQFSGTIRF